MNCSGLWPPVATPFKNTFEVDETAFVGHANNLLQEGASGLAMLGTTSEANSLSLAERHHTIDVLIGADIAPERLLPGTGACAVSDAVALSGHATRQGCAGVLLLPPFFFKGVSDAGLETYVSQVVEGVADDRLRIYLYHIPQMAGAGWSIDLIGRLMERFEGTIVGLKDSTGDWSHTKSIIEAFPDLAVFPANESHLFDAIPLGAAGCISATANVNARAISNLIAALRGKDAGTARTADLHVDVSAVREAIQGYPLVPAVKHVLALQTGDPTWKALRPPLVELTEEQARALEADPAVQRIIDGPI